MKFIEFYRSVLRESNDEVGCATIIRKGEKILLLKRGAGAPWMPNKWNLAGGVMDAGESPEKCARREAREETGLVLGKLVKIATIPQPWGTFHLFLTDETHGTVNLSWENTEFGWFTLDEIKGMDLVPPLHEYLIKNKCL